MRGKQRAVDFETKHIEGLY